MIRARYLDDRAEFVASINRVAPDVLREWNDLAATAPDRDEVVAFLRRRGLGLPGLEWLVDGCYCSVRSTTGDPWPWPRVPDGELPMPAGGVLTHDMSPIVLSWDPAESGETASAFRKRAGAAVDERIRRVEAWMRAAGVELPPQQRERGAVETGPARWDLLVSRIVLGLTYDAIGREVGLSKENAKKHVEALAARLGVTLPRKRT